MAGPVVAGACVFLTREGWPAGLDDSKKLSRERRRRLVEELTGGTAARWATGVATVEEIDRLNILQATFLAMRRALAALGTEAATALVDGSQMPVLPARVVAVVKGDGKSPSIAAASILAKETRDRMMEAAEEQYPGYEFGRHKGYGTARHLAALERLGPCALHRRSFAPVARGACRC